MTLDDERAAATLLIPRSVFEMLVNMGRLAASNEYALLLKGHLISPCTWKITEVRLPYQEVTPYHFKLINENILKWNGIIHHHPPAMPDFSHEDRVFLDPIFYFSILFLIDRKPYEHFPHASWALCKDEGGKKMVKNGYR